MLRHEFYEYGFPSDEQHAFFFLLVRLPARRPCYLFVKQWRPPLRIRASLFRRYNFGVLRSLSFLGLLYPRSLIVSSRVPSPCAGDAPVLLTFLCSVLLFFPRFHRKYPVNLQCAVQPTLSSVSQHWQRFWASGGSRSLPVLFFTMPTSPLFFHLLWTSPHVQTYPTCRSSPFAFKVFFPFLRRPSASFHSSAQPKPLPLFFRKSFFPPRPSRRAKDPQRPICRLFPCRAIPNHFDSPGRGRPNILNGDGWYSFPHERHSPPASFLLYESSYLSFLLPRLFVLFSFPPP